MKTTTEVRIVVPESEVVTSGPIRIVVPESEVVTSGPIRIVLPVTDEAEVPEEAEKTAKPVRRFRPQ